MRNRFRLIGMAAVAALSLTAMAIQDGVVLKRLVKEGETRKYKLTADMEFNGEPANMAATIIDKFTKVASNGEYTVESTQSELKLSFQGQEISPPDQVQTMVFDADGHVLNITSEQADANAYRMANLTNMEFPKTALKVGDSWTTTIKKDDKGAVDGKGTYKVEAMEKLNGVDTYRIKGGFKESVTDSPGSVDATYWISLKDGDVVKTTGTMTNAPLPIGPTTMKFTMTRV